jgi:hypothetical protein
MQEIKSKKGGERIWLQINLMVIGTGRELSKTEARFTTKETTAGQRETLIPADSWIRRPIMNPLRA